MVKIKSAAEIARKWATVTPGRSRFWEEAIKALSPEEWAEAAKAAAPNWEQGVTEAAARGAFAAGVEAKKERWRRKALTLGPARYGPGVRAAEPDFNTGFAPYRDVIANLTLSPRGPRGAPGNYERVREIGEALHNKRVGG